MTCSSCGLRIIWAYTTRHRRMPVNADPSSNGTVRVTHGSAEVLTGLFLEKARADGEDLYVSHFATCPEADRHRKKGEQNASV